MPEAQGSVARLCKSYSYLGCCFLLSHSRNYGVTLQGGATSGHYSEKTRIPRKRHLEKPHVKETPVVSFSCRKHAASSATPLGLRRQHVPFLLVNFQDTLVCSECKHVFQSAGGDDNAPLM